MTVEQTNTIDFSSIDKNSGEFVLTISDHLPWSEDEGQHLQILQDKLNAYLRFIESGELARKMPASEGRKVIISIVGKYEFSHQGKIFFERARNAVSGAGFELEFRLMRPN